MFVVYKGDDEVLITTQEREAEFLDDFFGIRGTSCDIEVDKGRILEEYDRTETDESGIQICSRMVVD
jgi:hypothetical protein